jgi:predicted phage terminase large subunit-like protein
MGWSVVYRKAINDDGSLLFPERLSKEFLEQARRTMGSYLFANQYQNEVIPEDEKRFKPQWIRYFKTIPSNTYRFAFVDPAIGQRDRNDYTGISLIDVDSDGHWYLRLASRVRLTPTQIVDKLFELQTTFNCQGIGIETVAYQEALLYILSEKMRERKMILPVKGISRTKVSKETRILGLVPRFEWGGISVAQGMTDFEDEYNSFPRGAHDDILDSIASLEEIVFYPQKQEKKLEKPASPHHPDYERFIIQQLSQRDGGQGEY